MIQQMPYEQLHDPDFLERVKRSATYFADTLQELLEKPIRLTMEVKTGNKQAMTRLSHALPDLRQAWLSHRYLFTRIAEQGFTVSRYLREKQMSMLDALDESLAQPKRERKKKEKPKTWEVTFQLYRQGMTPQQIAAQRGLTPGTIFSHLVRFVDAGHVKLDDLIPPERQKAIMRVIRMVGTDQGTTAIKSLCPADVTYDEIRLILNYTQHHSNKS